MGDKAKSRNKKKQSNLSRALASSSKRGIVLGHFFSSLSSSEIRRSVSKVAHHRHFESAISLNASGANKFYVRKTPLLSLEKNLSWCLGVIEQHASRLQFFTNAQSQVLHFLLRQEYTKLINVLESVELKCGLTVWGVSLKGTILAISDPNFQREYLEGLLSAADNNSFFKSMARNLVERFDDPEILASESKFFEQKLKRSFSGEMLHFLMYKLVPFNVEFKYDFEHILQIEKDSSPEDIYQCILDFLICNLHASDDLTRNLCLRTVRDLRRIVKAEIVEDLAVAFGDGDPPEPESHALQILDLYSSGAYESVCMEMTRTPELIKTFSLVEIWAKSLARHPNLMPSGGMQTLLCCLRDVVQKTSDYQKSKSFLLAHCHALSMIPWFKELRYFVERETNFYNPKTNDTLKATSLLISHFTSPAKSLVLVARGHSDDQLLQKFNSTSVTSRLFTRINSVAVEEPTDSELEGIEPNRKLKFRAMWNLSRGAYTEAIPLLQELRKSADIRVAHDASRSLVEAYRSAGDAEKAAEVYVDAILGNENLLSAFDSAGLCEACIPKIHTGTSIAIPIVFSIHSRFINDEYDAALKFSFERYLVNNQFASPLEVTRSSNILLARVDYFLQHVCTPDVMKLYLHFESTKEIEECRIEICKILIERGVATEDLVFEVKDRTRRLVVRDATNQVEHSRIFSDANFLGGPSTLTFRSLYERFVALRSGDYSAAKDEIAFARLVPLMEADPLIRGHAYAIHIQDLVLNEKNAVFLKLLKLARDEFAFGEKGLNVYLSTRIRHGHFPNTIRKSLIDNHLLASRATDTAGYRLKNDWATFLKLDPFVRDSLEHSLIEFSVKFNALVDEVNDTWLRLFTFDLDISGLSKDVESKEALFNYSVTALESFFLQRDLDEKSTFTDFVAVANKWLWSRTEQNLESIRSRISEQMRASALGLIEDLGKATIPKYGVEVLGDFPDSLARARIGLNSAFDTVQGWFTRSKGGSIPKFELDIAVTIARMAANADVAFEDRTQIVFDGRVLNPMVDVFYILFENCISKSGVLKSSLKIEAHTRISNDSLILSVSNNCFPIDDISIYNQALDRYRTPAENSDFSVGAAQGEGGSGFFKIWRAIAKDMNLVHATRLGYVAINRFNVEIEIPLSELRKVVLSATASN